MAFITSPRTAVRIGLPFRSSVLALLHPVRWIVDRSGSKEKCKPVAEGDAARRRVAMLVAGAGPLEDVLAAACDETARLIGAPVTALLRHEAEGKASVAAIGGASAALVRHTLLRREVAPPALEVPVLVSGREWGVLAAWRPEPRPAGRVSARALAGVAGIADLIAIAIASAEARSELAASRARIIAMADEARRRLERDLHDGAQQRLVTLALDLRAAEAAVPPGLSELKSQLGKASADVARALIDLQEIARGIHPAVLSHGGLRPALKGLASRCPIPVHRRVSLDRRLPESYEIALYYFVSEALTNVVKHATASAIWLDLRIEQSSVRLIVRDDGVGGATPDGGSGLVGLQDRIEALGGSFGVNSPDGGGTSLTARIPLSAEPS
jgi:signal transduction histidine kinase